MSACPKAGRDGDCGQEHPKCIAHSKRSGGPCMGDPMRGTDPPRCRHHVGVRPALVKAQADTQAAAVALYRQQREAAERHGLTGELIDPLQALHDLADEGWRWKEACRTLVGELKELRYRSGQGENLRSEVALYERAIERVGRLLVDITRLGIEDRMAKVASRQLSAVGDAIEGAIAELGPLLGFDPEDNRIRPVIAKHLRKVER